MSNAFVSEFLISIIVGLFSFITVKYLLEYLLRNERRLKLLVRNEESPHRITTRNDNLEVEELTSTSMKEQTDKREEVKELTSTSMKEQTDKREEVKELTSTSMKEQTDKREEVKELTSTSMKEQTDKREEVKELTNTVFEQNKYPIVKTSMSIEERMHLIARNATDTIGLDALREKIGNGLSLRGYLGTAPTRSPSIGYFIPLMKFRDLVQADVDMTMFIADVHAFLDKGSRWIDRTSERTTYYIFIISEILKTLSVEPSEYVFIKGSEIQLDSVYIMDLFKLLTTVSDKQAKKAGSEVVKQNKDVMLSSLIYPLMQIIDAAALSADIEIGGLDQRKIFALGRDNIETLGYDKCAHVMNELLPSLGKPGSKMSSSDVMGKIEFTDTKERIAEKLKKAYCVEKEVADNPCMALARLIIFPIKESLGEYKSYEDLEHAWINGMINAKQLKELLSDAIDVIIDPIRKTVENNRELYDSAFPAVEPLLVESANRNVELSKSLSVVSKDKKETVLNKLSECEMGELDQVD